MLGGQVLRSVRSAIMKPQKLINVKEEMPLFSNSKAKKTILDLVTSVSKAVVGHTIPTFIQNSKVQALVDVLNNLQTLAEEIEPTAGRQRFGNTAYRVWFKEAQPKMTALHELDTNADWDELDHYLFNSFGSPQRLDYGTGHELNFLAFLGGLLSSQSLNTVTGNDILYIFNAYYNTIQFLLRRYNLEPAGSHGVWGLDDHFHLSYILGSAQLAFGADDGTLTPKSVLDPSEVSRGADKNLYLKSIQFVLHVKKGPFFEHSPILYDASNVNSWTKVHRGMVKMYMEEVLNKFPVVQHFWFGSLYPLDPLVGDT